MKCATPPTVCNKDHGIYAGGTANTVTNNLIYDNLANGIQLEGYTVYNPDVHAGPEYAVTDGWFIANNIIAYQNHRAGLMVWRNVKNTRIENNIFYENGTLMISGTAQAVSFSVTGLPSDVTASFSPASCAPNCSSTLTLFASASAATGNAAVTVTAAGGGISRTSAFTLTVNATTRAQARCRGASQVGGEHFNGKLDEARVYSRALSAAEVQALSIVTVNAPPKAPTGFALR